MSDPNASLYSAHCTLPLSNRCSSLPSPATLLTEHQTQGVSLVRKWRFVKWYRPTNQARFSQDLDCGTIASILSIRCCVKGDDQLNVFLCICLASSTRSSQHRSTGTYRVDGGNSEFQRYRRYPHHCNPTHLPGRNSLHRQRRRVGRYGVHPAIRQTRTLSQAAALFTKVHRPYIGNAAISSPEGGLAGGIRRSWPDAGDGHLGDRKPSSESHRCCLPDQTGLRTAVSPSPTGV